MTERTFDKERWWEMVRAAKAGHPTAIQWVWWEHFIGFWVWLGRLHELCPDSSKVWDSYSRGIISEESGQR